MKISRLTKKIGIYFVGNISSKLLTILLIPIYAYYISSTDLGQYDFIQSLMNITVIIAYIAIWEAILRFLLGEKDEKMKKNIISTSVIFVLVVSLLLTIIVYFYFRLKTPYPFLSSLMIMFYGIAQIWQYYARALEKNIIYMQASIISIFVNFTGAIIFICILKLGLLGLILSYLMGRVSVFLILERNLHILNKIDFKFFDKKIIKDMIVFSAPLAINLVSGWLISGYGRLIINSKLGEYANGLYAFADKFSMVFTSLGAIVTMAIIEEAILEVKNDNKYCTNLINNINKISKIFASLALFMLPCISVFYLFIDNTVYGISLQFVPGLLLYALIMSISSNIGSLFQVIDKTKYQFWTTLLGSIITLCVSYIMVDKVGITAIITGQVIGSLLTLFSRYLIIGKYFDINIKWKIVIMIFIIYMTISYLIIKYTSITEIIFILALDVLLIIFINKNTLISFIMKAKKDEM